MPYSAYIHIPFCSRKCYYCTFSSYPKINLKEKYLQSLLFEIEKRYKGDKLQTLYIGGGTPSLLSVTDIKNILSEFKFEKSAEITCEVNPEELTTEWLQGIFDLGINRLSVGIQSFDENLLKLIGRRHTVQDAVKTINNAKNIGFKNISLDLIYGLPEQNICDVATSTITACELGVQHISSYGLKIEKGSAFYNKDFKNLPDDDLQADMYLKIIEIVKNYGFSHYEISNFAKKGFESKHNLNYWDADTYYGFGCAASGYEKDIRYSHPSTIEKYLENPTFLTEKTLLSQQHKLEEFIFLGLRKSKGFKIDTINKKFDIDFKNKYAKILQKYEKYFANNDEYCSLNDEGFLISNFILSEFIDE